MPRSNYGAEYGRDAGGGSYALIAEAHGFKKSIPSRIHLDISQPRGIDLAPEVGSVSEIVTVTGYRRHQ